MLKIHVLTGLLLLCTTSLAAAPAADFESGKLDEWKTEGSAWGVVKMVRMNAQGGFHAESLAGGEQATGILKSEPFTITGNVLSFLANGWDGRYGGKGINGYFLKKAGSGEILRSAAPPCNDSFFTINWAIGDLKGQTVYFEAVDRDKDTAFAWLGVDDIRQQSLSETTLHPMKLGGNSTWTVMDRNGAGTAVSPYLSSLGMGEVGTGTVASPEFVIDTDTIRFDLCGHNSNNGEKQANFVCLRDVVTKELLRTTYAPGCDIMVPCQWDVRELRGRRVRFEAVDRLADNGYSWIGVNNIDAGQSMKFTFAGKSLPAGWAPTELSDLNYVTACGVPFLALPASQSCLIENGETRLECGFTAQRFFLLGMINTWDQGNPCWAWPDYSQRLFIGDRAGDLIIEYTDGTKDNIPLIFGYTMWWYNNYTAMGATEPFSSDPAAKKTLDNALNLYPTASGGGHAYVCQIKPKSKAIAALRVVDNPKKKGAPMITAITFDTDGTSSNLEAPCPAAPATKLEQKWLKDHVVSADSFSDEGTAQKLDALRRTIYTSEADLKGPFAVDVPKGFRGPDVRLKGTPYAELLTNIYYHSTQDMDDKVDTDGTFHTSTKDNPSWGGYEGFGAWSKKSGPYYTHAWSRDLGRVLQELTELGYDSDSKACSEWCNKQLMWFPQQFPKVNVKGKPVPGHWVRIINLQEWVQTPGMPKLFGNLENDGHGLIMLFQYRAWLASGKNPDYVKANWETVREAAEYICWLFDNPDVSRAKENALFSESEGGGMNYSIYCDFPCWLGLTGYADMAKAAGKADDEKRWRSYAARLEDGFNYFYPKKDPAYGDIWDPGKNAGWPYGHAVLAPVIIWPDYHGFDLSGMPKDWLERSRNTFRFQLTRCDPDHGSGIAMGYGQCFLTEAALLLDEMRHGEKCLNRLAGFTYCKGYKPYIIPEGCEIDESHTWWHRTGDLGNAVQEGEGVKCVRIVLGIDDTKPERTLFIPRMPHAWSEISAERYPVNTFDGSRIVKRNVEFKVKRSSNRCEFTVNSDGPLAETALRIGPFAPSVKQVKVSVNGEDKTLSTFRSGDSTWAWINGLRGMSKLTVASEEMMAR